MSQPVIDFASYISRSTANFAERKWVFEAIDAWLADSKREHRFLLTGMPDMGKTVIAAHLVQCSLGTPPPADCDQLTKGVLSAWHFCSARNLLWIGPHIFAGTQASQLAAQYPLFKQALLQKSDEDRTITITSIQNVERLIGGQMTDIGIDNVKARNIPHLDAFNRVVRELLEPLSHGYEQTAGVLQWMLRILTMAKWPLLGYAIYSGGRYLDGYRTCSIA